MSPKQTTTSWRRASSVIAGVTLIAATLVGSSSPANADPAILLSGVQNGTVGVAQNVGIVVSNAAAPCGSVQANPPTIVGTQNNVNVNLGTAAFAACNGTSYQYTFQWIPTIATVWYLTATSDGFTSNALRAAISPVSTTISLAAPATARLGAPVTLTATVAAPNTSQYSAPGSVQFSVQGGGAIGSPVQLNGAVPAQATINWTPAALGQVSLIATYIPGSVNGITSTACTNSCSSTPDVVQVTSSGVNVYLTNPPQFFVGVPNTVTAQVSVVPPSGSVSFFVNGQSIGANVPVQSNGQATTRWTPSAPGNFTLSANWIGNNGTTGGSQESVSVAAGGGQTDSIVLTPAGQPSWSPNGTYQMANGVSLTFNVATSSGSPATLTDRGPCNLSGNTLTADQGNGACVLIASSPGGNGLAPVTVNYNISLVPGTQVPSFTPPASGRFRSGRVLILESATQQDTNAGQQINWRVRPNSRSVCRVQFPNNGSVTLRLTGRGTCNVVGNAPAVPGQWSALNLRRSYVSR